VDNHEQSSTRLETRPTQKRSQNLEKANLDRLIRCGKQVFHHHGIHSTTNNALANTARKPMRNRIVSVLVIAALAAVVVVGASVGAAAAAARRRRDRTNSASSSASSPSSSSLRLSTGNLTRTFINMLRTNHKKV
jgi:hypothetical protein